MKEKCTYAFLIHSLRAIKNIKHTRRYKKTDLWSVNL